MLDKGLVQDDGGGFFVGEQYGTWIFSIIGAICVGLSGIFPLLVIPIESGPGLKYGEPAKKLRLMLSFAVGSLLGDVFLHLLPEVWAQLDRSRHDCYVMSSLWVICGLLGFMCIEKVMGEGEEEEEEEEEEKKKSIDGGYGDANDTDSCASTSNNNKISSISNVSLSSSSLTSTSSKISSSSSSSSSSPKLLSSSSPSSKKGNRDSHTTNSMKNGKKTASKNSKPKSSDHHHGHKNGKLDDNNRGTKNNAVSSQEPKIKVSGYLNLFANVVDNFTHGLAVGSSFCVSKKVGCVTTFAILLHEIPHEVGDFAILLQSGFDKWKAAKAQVWTASGGVIGAITALAVDRADVTGGLSTWILPFTSGGFIYIALVTVVPDLLQEKHPWESLKQGACICLGVLSIIIVTFALD